MEPLTVLVAGAGPAGLLAVDKLLGTSAFDVNLFLLDRAYAAEGIPKTYSTVQPNSPFHDLYAFLMELQAEDVLSAEGSDRAATVLQRAREQPSLACITDAFQLLWEDVLSDDERLHYHPETEVQRIVEQPDGTYRVEAKEFGITDTHFTADVVVSAIGARPKENPYTKVFGTEIPLPAALDATATHFKGKKVVIAGASHSAAIAFINAVAQGAKRIEVWYRGTEPFRPHHVDDDNTKHYQFTGINEPTLGRLRGAMGAFKKYELKPTASLPSVTQLRKSGAYRDWCIVPAIGFERSPLPFLSQGGVEGPLEHLIQGEQFMDCAPNLCYPGTADPVPRVYGLGLAHPLTFTNAFLANSVEAPNARVVGVFFTNELSKLIVPDILQHWPDRLNE